MNLRRIDTSLIKYLAAVSAMFALPLLLPGLIVFRRFFTILEQRITAASESQVYEVFEELESDLDQLGGLTHQIYLAKTYSRYYLRENPLHRYQAINEMKNINLLIPNVKTFYLIYYNDPYIYSPGTAYTYDNLKRFVLDGNENSWKSLEQIFSEANNSAILFEEELGKLFIIHMIKSNSHRPYGAVIYELGDYFLDGGVREKQVNGLFDVYLLSSDNRIIMSSAVNGGYTNVSEDDLALLLDKEDKGVATLNTARYFFSSLISPSTGLKYVSLSPYSAVMADLLRLRKIYFSTFGAIVALILTVIALLLRYNYRPLHKLRIISENIVPGRPKSGGNAEFQIINEAINYLSVQNENLNEKINSEQKLLADYHLRRLIKGEITDINAFLTETADLGLALHRPYHFIAMVYSSSFMAMPDNRYREILDTAERMLTDGSHLLDYRLTNTMVIFVSSKQAQLPLTRFEELRKKLENFCCEEVTIGIGGVYQDISQALRMYMESSMALESGYLNGRNRVLVYQPEDDEFAPDRIEEQPDIQGLKRAFIQMDPVRTKVALERIRSIMKSSRMPAARCRLLGYDVYKAYQESAVPGTGMLPEYFSSMTFGKLEVVILSDIRLRLETAREQKSSVRLEKITAIESTIRFRSGDPGFSLLEAAEAHGFTQSGLSLFYKEVRGSTINNYLTEVRMKEAKRLLAETDLTVYRIAMQSGYYSDSSFIRRFKQITGLTPGDYRTQSAGPGV